jgi:hypothetical protein
MENLASFDSFQSLPAEIRTLIWDAFLLSQPRRIVKITVIARDQRATPSWFSENERYTCNNINELIKSDNYAKILAQTCRESREYIKECYYRGRLGYPRALLNPIARDLGALHRAHLIFFNPDVDILHLCVSRRRTRVVEFIDLGPDLTRFRNIIMSLLVAEWIEIVNHQGQYIRGGRVIPRDEAAAAKTHGPGTLCIVLGGNYKDTEGTDEIPLDDFFEECLDDGGGVRQDELKYCRADLDDMKERMKVQLPECHPEPWARVADFVCHWADSECHPVLNGRRLKFFSFEHRKKIQI